MKKKMHSKYHILRVLVAALLILASLPIQASAANVFSAIVTSKNMKVYRDADLDDYWGRLPRNTVVRVKAYAGKVALISYGGRSGFAAISDMATVESVSVKAKTKCSTRVYEEADLDSDYAKVKKGVQVNVLAVEGSCALVERGGYVGYAYTGHLKFEESDFLPDIDLPPEIEDEILGNDGKDEDKKEEDKQEPEKEPEKEEDKKDDDDDIANLPSWGDTTGGKEEEKEEEKKDEVIEVPEKPSDSIEEIFASGKYSNEELCFYYMVYEMELSPAAAIGVMSNLRSESHYRPDIDGDDSNSYGVVQWHKGRKQRLFDWCAEKGYDKSTLLAQLRYMEYELKNYYSKVDKYIRSVDNSAQGAFDAAYYFCYHYEAPSNRAVKSTERGAYARDTIYPKYANK